MQFGNVTNWDHSQNLNLYRLVSICTALRKINTHYLKKVFFNIDDMWTLDIL